jgi:Fe2+ or Zn2+ uptake regulation protein
MILVWGTAEAMPTTVEERGRATGGRAECRADIVAVISAAGRALTHKQLVRALREAGTPHGPGTVMKALAELTRSGELKNPKDKKGYRLASWPTPGTPPLF